MLSFWIPAPHFLSIFCLSYTLPKLLSKPAFTKHCLQIDFLVHSSIFISFHVALCSFPNLIYSSPLLHFFPIDFPYFSTALGHLLPPWFHSTFHSLYALHPPTVKFTPVHINFLQQLNTSETKPQAPEISGTATDIHLLLWHSHYKTLFASLWPHLKTAAFMDFYFLLFIVTSRVYSLFLSKTSPVAPGRRLVMWYYLLLLHSFLFFTLTCYMLFLNRYT